MHRTDGNKSIVKKMVGKVLFAFNSGNMREIKIVSFKILGQDGSCFDKLHLRLSLIYQLL